MNQLLRSDDLTLVVGDVHVSAGQDVSRGKLLGCAINDLRPDRVVFIGDLLTLDSLSAWDKDKRKKMEGRRYQKDIDAGKRFLANVYSSGGHKCKEYILTEGNHEDRLWRYLDGQPLFDGAVDYREDLGITDLGWKYVPYKEHYVYKGVYFTHVPINEAGRPVGGDSACKRALGIYQHSVVFGHTHKLASVAVHRTGSAHLNQALNVGCFFEHVDDYALGSLTSYWRGIVLLDHYKTGRFNWSPISLGKLRKFKKTA
jgi:hypothetical protein